MIIIGIIFSRTKGYSIEGQPPGEAELLGLNPNRKKLILDRTEWNRLEPGTLNLEVSRQDFKNLLAQNPMFTELGSNVIYPDKYKHIPILRGKYYYYKAYIIDRETNFILVRRAHNTHLNTKLEVLAEINLRNSYYLNAKIAYP